jgi:hypothetical protein
MIARDHHGRDAGRRMAKPRTRRPLPAIAFASCVRRAQSIGTAPAARKLARRSCDHDLGSTVRRRQESVVREPVDGRHALALGRERQLLRRAVRVDHLHARTAIFECRHRDSRASRAVVHLQTQRLAQPRVGCELEGGEALAGIVAGC